LEEGQTSLRKSPAVPEAMVEDPQLLFRASYENEIVCLEADEYAYLDQNRLTCSTLAAAKSSLPGQQFEV
jgi:hypothetical protein